MNRVLAVTCAQWSDELALDRDDPAVEPAPLEHFAAESVQFHTHYLQQLHRDLFPERNSDSGIVDVNCVDDVDTLASRLVSLDDAEQKPILHVRIGTSRPPEVTAKLLPGALVASREFLHGQKQSDDQWLMIVTAESVSPGGDGAHLRQMSPVPLWVRLPSRKPGHVGGLTGSNDFAPTVDDWLGRGDDSTAPDVPDLQGDVQRAVAEAYTADPVSLLRLLDQPLLSERRRLFIQGDSFIAARDSEFLLVVPDEASPESDQMLLFRKPDDVWNLHEVSQQCPEIVQEMSAWLAAVPKA